MYMYMCVYTYIIYNQRGTTKQEQTNLDEPREDGVVHVRVQEEAPRGGAALPGRAHRPGVCWELLMVEVDGGEGGTGNALLPSGC